MNLCFLQRQSITNSRDDKQDVDTAKLSTSDVKVMNGKDHSQSSKNLVFGYLNLFSDGVVSVSSYCYFRNHLFISSPDEFE